jgi:CBS domain-containing membrane protein
MISREMTGTWLASGVGGDDRDRPAGGGVMKKRLRVRDLMRERVFTLRPDDELYAVRNLMDQKSIRHIPVTEPDQTLVGLISQRDLLRVGAVERSDLTLSLQVGVLHAVRIRDVMTRDVETVEPDDDIALAAQLMLENKYGCVPVVDGRRLVGILTESDFVRYVAEQA